MGGHSALVKLTNTNPFYYAESQEQKRDIEGKEGYNVAISRLRLRGLETTGKPKSNLHT